jgi:16S rRNA (adenine1518-N6/adenine1519-N6)-dimethyltransferase
MLESEDMVQKDQHIMIDEKVINRMIALADIKRGDIILEIGAGSGMLTKALVKKGANIIAVEVDKRFKEELEGIKAENLKLIFANALEVIDSLKFNKIIANIPYSICEPLINKLFRKNFEIVVLTVPENFYKILSAKPQDRFYSLLTIKANSFFKISFAFKVDKNTFIPPPKTESVIITLSCLSKEDYEKAFEKFILREIFLQRKKKLKNALMEAIINMQKQIFSRPFTKNMARKMIREMAFNTSLLEKRSENLTFNEVIEIIEKLRILRVEETLQPLHQQ